MPNQSGKRPNEGALKRSQPFAEQPASTSHDIPTNAYPGGSPQGLSQSARDVVGTGMDESREQWGVLDDATISKRMPRALQACKACRTSKIKCDEMAQCKNCTLKGIECVRDPFQPKITASTSHSEIVSRLDDLLHSQGEFQNAMMNSFPVLGRELKRQRQLRGSFSRRAHSNMSPSEDSTFPPDPSQHMSTSGFLDSQQPDMDSWTAQRREESAREGTLDVQSKPALPSDHTTGWARILQWPAVTTIVGERMRSENLSSDPMQQEIARDLLYPIRNHAPYGANPRHKSNDGNYSANRAGDIAMSNSESRSNYRYRDAALREASTAARSFTDDDLCIDVSTISRLIDNYNSKITVMHPIVTREHLDHLLGMFWRLLPDIRAMLVAGRTLINNSHTDSESSISKQGSRMQNYMYSPPWDARKCVQMSIVLLVLALGQACDRTVSSSPEFEGRRQHPIVQETRGILFFNAAMDILCSQVCANSYEHVQANLLAGLYYGQFCRVLESYTHYSNASRALYMILSPRRAYLETLPARNKKLSVEENLLVITFWICLQLESDIIAEIDVPQSPILAWESRMPWPDLEKAVEMGLEARNMESFIALLWLRKRLNHIHTELYGPGMQEGYTLANLNHMQKLPFIDSLRESLEGSNVIAPSWSWDAGEAPARNILAARLRGKYYGGVVIVYRPFLRMVINNGLGESPEAVPPGSISHLIMVYATRCIEALIQSTRAFQNVDGGQPIITNPWGTAYAQAGNTLLLIAVYKNELLKRFIDLEVLQDLVRRTLTFVSSVAQSSPALWNIYRVLEVASIRILGPQGGDKDR